MLNKSLSPRGRLFLAIRWQLLQKALGRVGNISTIVPLGCVAGQSLALSINEEIRSRVTYSVVLPRLSPEAIEQFILGQLDRAGLGHNTFSPEALALIVRSGEGLLRRTRNLCLGALIEAVRDQTRSVDLKQVNHVLIQPHWRNDCDHPLV